MAAGRLSSGMRRGLVPLVLVATAMLGGCGGGPEPADGGEGAAGGDTALAGTMTGYLTGVTPDGITFDEIEVLSGDAAEAAREEDGEPPIEDGLDIPYLRNLSTDAYEIAVASDVSVEVVDCANGCRLVDWSYEDLVDGAPLPYGSAESPFTVTVEDGEVVSIAEMYLP